MVDPAGQQVSESLAALVSVRLWKAYGNGGDVPQRPWRTRCDATLELNMRPRTRQRRLISQELALGLAEFPLFLWLRNICVALLTPWLTRYREGLNQCRP